MCQGPEAEKAGPLGELKTARADLLEDCFKLFQIKLFQPKSQLSALDWEL